MFRGMVLCGLLAFVAGCSGGADSERGALTTSGAATASLPSPSFGGLAPPPARAVTFATLPDKGNLVAYPSRAVRRDGAYTWHRASLSEQHALQAIVDGRLTVTAPSGETLDFRYKRHVEHPSGDWTWVGELEGAAQGEETILTFGEKAAFGTIAQPGKEPLRLTVRDGVSWLVETDRKALAATNNAATRPRGPDFFIPPKLAKRQSASASVPSVGSGAGSSTAAAAAAAANTVDLVLGYTTGFAASLGGQSQAVTRLNFLVDVTNQAYVNSQVDARVRLVHALQVDYSDATSNDTALEELTGFRAPSTPTTPAAAFSALRAARNQYGGDLVSLVRKFNTPENDGCGIAWLIGGGQSGIDASDEYFGYSVVSDGTDMGTDGKTYYCRDETFAHETAHNMGSQHDRTTATVDGSLKYGVYPYSFAYRTAAGAGNFYTVMAYGETGQTRYRVFSNPRTTYCGGYPCGVADDADNARSLAQTIPTIAAFRATVVVDPAPGPARRFVDDVDGDARSDILWQNASAGRFGYWQMNGAVIGPTGNMPLTIGYRTPAAGDFDGNGRMDVLWTSEARDLWLWSGTGTGAFISTYLGTYSDNWAVSGAGDINADGKDDILWHNAVEGRFGYWLMNGASVTQVVSMPVAVGYRIASSGDFNGDGRLDLFWTSNQGDLWLWSGTAGSQFTSNFMGTYGNGWAVIGAGDVNADGTDDLLWHNAATGRFGYWLLNGASVLQVADMAVTVGYRVASSGDYNGDGRVDLVWTSSNFDLWLWSGTASSAFNSNFLGNYGDGWRVIDPGLR